MKSIENQLNFKWKIISIQGEATSKFSIICCYTDIFRYGRGCSLLLLLCEKLFSLFPSILCFFNSYQARIFISKIDVPVSNRIQLHFIYHVFCVYIKHHISFCDQNKYFVLVFYSFKGTVACFNLVHVCRHMFFLFIRLLSFSIDFFLWPSHIQPTIQYEFSHCQRRYLPIV